MSILSGKSFLFIELVLQLLLLYNWSKSPKDTTNFDEIVKHEKSPCIVSQSFIRWIRWLKLIHTSKDYFF